MKVFVVTQSNGKIVGTARGDYRHSDGSTYAFRPIPLEGQKVHDVQLPPELEQMTDPSELHRRLEEHMAK